LLRLQVHDVERLGPDIAEPLWLLRQVPSQRARDAVLARWNFDLAGISAFAEALLRALGEDLVRHPALLDNVRRALIPRAVKSSESQSRDASALRELLASHFPDDVRAHPALADAYAEDCRRSAREEVARQREREQRESEERVREAQLQAEWRARATAIASMPLVERIEYLLSTDNDLRGPYPLEWADVSPTELSELPSTERLRLIRQLRWKHNQVYRVLRYRLQAPDRQAKLDRRSELEAALLSLPFSLQLEHLASSEMTVGMYPVWLAARAMEHAEHIDLGLRLRLRDRLRGQRRGIWRELRDALRVT
jgi:hypothetical protein